MPAARKANWSYLNKYIAMPSANQPAKPITVADYIKPFPPAVRKHLNQCRKLILGLAPDAVESISYGMPGYKLKGKPLVYFAAFQQHIGLYATPSAHTRFSKELSRYRQGKGSVQFPLDEPMPWALIEKMVRFKMEEIGGKG